MYRCAFCFREFETEPVMDRGRSFCCNSCSLAMAKLEGRIPREEPKPKKAVKKKVNAKPKKKAKKRK